MSAQHGFVWARSVLAALTLRWGPVLVAVTSSATSLAAENPPTSLPFRLYQEHMIVVKGSIGAWEGLDFLIDTGSTRTLVDRKIAEKLRLEPLEGDVQIASFKNGQARKVMVSGLLFGPVLVECAPMLAADLSFSSWAGRRIHAIIGLDVLRLNSFSVDYASRRITFGPVEDSPAAVSFQAVSPLLTVDLEIGGRRARVMVDTGAPRLTLFPNRMRSRLPGFLLRGARPVQTVGGMSQLRDIELASVRLGPAEWLHVRAFLGDAPASIFDGLDGVLGPTSLAIRRLRFDFVRNRLSWER